MAETNVPRPNTDDAQAVHDAIGTLLGYALCIRDLRAALADAQGRLRTQAQYIAALEARLGANRERAA